MKRLSAATLFFVSIIFLCIAGLPAQSAGNKTQSASSSNKAIHINTRWLPNGLRVVEVTGPWPSDIVSIRLIVHGGFMNFPREDKLGFHFLEHLMFRGGFGNFDPFGSEGERCGRILAAIGPDYQVHEFDIDETCAGMMLETVLSEWDREGVSEGRVGVERSRIRGEYADGGFTHPLALIGNEHKPHRGLDYLNDAEVAFVDSVSDVTLRRIFEERYVANNMSLLVAGSAEVIAGLRPVIDKFGELPRSGGSQTSAFGDLTWLSEDVQTRWPSVSVMFGFHFSAPDIAPRVRYLTRQGAFSRVERDLEKSDLFADVLYDGGCYATDREVWGIVLESSEHDKDKIFDRIRGTLDSLCLDSALPYWRDFLERESTWQAISTHSPGDVLDCIVEDVGRSAQSEAAAEWTDYAEPMSAREVQDAYRRIYTQATEFRTYLDKKRNDMSLWYPADDSENLLKFLLEGRNEGDFWWIAALLTGLITATAGVRIAARLGSDVFYSRFPRNRRHR